MKYRMSKNRQGITPSELMSLFYNNALMISDNNDDAAKLANEAVVDFLSHYRNVKQRTHKR